MMQPRKPPSGFFSKSASSQPIIETRHGRVNLIGEHTDYNQGLVLPMLIPQGTTVTLVPRTDDRVRCGSVQFMESGVTEYQLGSEHRTEERRWCDHVMGVTKIAADSGLGPLHGFEVWIDSSVPVGSGLSSSAALEVALFNALLRAFGWPEHHRDRIPRLAQRVEREFIGAQVGIMDQMVIHHAQPGEAMFLDVQTMSRNAMKLPARARWLVINSRVPHDHSAGDYNTRVSECQEACRLLGVESLRECDERDLKRIDQLPEPFRRRARHVVTENVRVRAAAQSLQDSDLPTLGLLMNQSHESQRLDYEVSIPEIDGLVEIARRQSGVLGARLTGGGFGGSIVVLADRGNTQAIGQAILSEYSNRFGANAELLTPTSGDHVEQAGEKFM
jgi:galactokinase